MSDEQAQVVIYAMFYGGGTVNGFAQGFPGSDIPKRTRKSALELINRTARSLGLEEKGANSLREIAEEYRSRIARPVAEVPSVEELIGALKEFGENWDEANDVADYTFEQFQQAQGEAIHALLIQRQWGR